MRSPRKVRREIAIGEDVVVFSPVVYDKGSWRPRQHAIYRITLNGAEVAWIDYERGAHQGHRLMTYGFSWTRLLESRAWACPTEVRRLSPFTVETFEMVASNLASWMASGQVMTKEQAGTALESWLAEEEVKAAEREARHTAEREKRERQKAAAERDRGDMIEGLQSIRDRLSASLTNFEAAALERAINRS